MARTTSADTGDGGGDAADGDDEPTCSAASSCNAAVETEGGVVGDVDGDAAAGDGGDALPALVGGWAACGTGRCRVGTGVAGGVCRSVCRGNRTGSSSASSDPRRVVAPLRSVAGGDACAVAGAPPGDAARVTSADTRARTALSSIGPIGGLGLCLAGAETAANAPVAVFDDLGVLSELCCDKESDGDIDGGASGRGGGVLAQLALRFTARTKASMAV